MHVGTEACTLTETFLQGRRGPWYGTSGDLLPSIVGNRGLAAREVREVMPGGVTQPNIVFLELLHGNGLLNGLLSSGGSWESRGQKMNLGMRIKLIDYTTAIWVDKGMAIPVYL